MLDSVKPEGRGIPRQMASLPHPDLPAYPPPDLTGGDDGSLESPLHPKTEQVYTPLPELPEHQIHGPEHVPLALRQTTIAGASSQHEYGAIPEISPALHLPETQDAVDRPSSPGNLSSSLYVVHSQTTNFTESCFLSLENDRHAVQHDHTQSTAPPAPKYERPMTQNTREKVRVEFEDLEMERDALDLSLLDECQRPAVMSRYTRREELLQRAAELAERERRFLSKWTLELEKRERLLR